MAIEDVEKLIEKHKPRVVFAPHVETSTGVELPLEYIKRIGEMTRRASDGIFVLDGIAAERRGLIQNRIWWMRTLRHRKKGGARRRVLVLSC